MRSGTGQGREEAPKHREPGLGGAVQGGSDEAAGHLGGSVS